MVFITKANGEKEAFSEEKLRRSIHNAGIQKDMEDEVVAHVTSKLHEHMPTSEIYQHIIEFLDKSSSPYTRSRYSLKQAIMALGPTGYPFEDYLARLLQKEGYQTTVRNIIQGKCVSHEIDIVATKEKEKIMVEAKFHNSVGVKTDVHVALYTWARYEDVAKKGGFTKPMLITNTKLTTDAVMYAQCMGMEILGWSYPEKRSLRELVEEYHLHPITSLVLLSQSQKQQLLTQNIVLCHELVDHPESLSQFGLGKEKEVKVLQEARFTCSGHID